MKTLIKWQDGMAFAAETESGHTVMMDGSPDIGGENRGARPMEMVLVGLGGCTSIDVVLMLQKLGQNISDCQVEISAERVETIPKVFKTIHVHFKVYGKDLNEKKVARAVNLSAEKYCSVSKMLEKSVEISHDYEMIEA